MSILNDIIDWVQDKPLFWQVTIDKLIRNNTLTDVDIKELSGICKSQFGLSEVEIDSVDIDDLRRFANHSTSSNSIVLSKIFNIENINALSKESILEFSPIGLTVIYGDNGAGKSSYVSILKHICNTRGQKPLINNNLYDPTSRGNNKFASVEYTLDCRNFDSVQLSNTAISNSILKSVHVFDVLSAIHYIEGEDEIAFIPHGLSIIETFALYLKQIENELKSEVQSLETAKFDFSVLQLDDGSNAKLFIDYLNENTTLNELRAKAKWNKDKDERITELTKTINELKESDPLEKIKNNQGKINRFNILKSKFKHLEDKLLQNSIEKMKSVLNQYVIKSQSLKDASNKIFSDLPVEGVGNDTWKQLWESARKFYNESKNKVLFPEVVEGSNCPLCLQDLDEHARKRFTGFEEFVKQDIQKEYDNALNEYNKTINDLTNLSFDFEDQEPTINELEELYEKYKEIQSFYLTELINYKAYLLKQLANKEVLENLTVPNLEINAKTIIKNLVDILETENEELKTQSIEEKLKPLEKELCELINEKKLCKFKPKIAREICRQKKVSLLNQCSDKCNTRLVTNLSNRLTTTHVNQTLRENFKLELEKIGFTNFVYSVFLLTFYLLDKVFGAKSFYWVASLYFIMILPA